MKLEEKIAIVANKTEDDQFQSLVRNFNEIIKLLHLEDLRRRNELWIFPDIDFQSLLYVLKATTKLLRKMREKGKELINSLYYYTYEFEKKLYQ